MKTLAFTAALASLALAGEAKTIALWPFGGRSRPCRLLTEISPCRSAA